jgi:methionyl-tRNA formyltransferase
MQMDSGLDTGDIMSIERFCIDENVTYPALHDRLASVGSDLLIKTLDKLQQGHIIPTPQSANNITYAEKLRKCESEINWQDSAQEIDRMIRALNPWPGVFFTHGDQQIKILRARILESTDPTTKPGTVLDDQLNIQCGKDILCPVLLQKPGKSKVSTAEFLRGYKIQSGTILT